jgi:SAM-dependent methyltransferase
MASHVDPAPPHESFAPALFEVLAQAEDKHFWFRARNRIIAATVRRVIASFAEGYRVLEVGCGTGNVLRVLEQVCSRGTVTGMDLFAEGLEFARQRTRCALVVGDIRHPPFDAPFDLVGMFDVLEHLPDDIEVLRAVRRLVAPGRMLLLTVPAHPELWSYFDEASCHCRRYRINELRSKLASAGFEIEFMTEFMAGLYPLVWAGRRLAGLKKRKNSETAASNMELTARELRIVPVFNQLMLWLLSREARWIAARRRLPVGTSIMAVARNPSLVA